MCSSPTTATLAGHGALLGGRLLLATHDDAPVDGERAPLRPGESRVYLAEPPSLVADGATRRCGYARTRPALVAQGIEHRSPKAGVAGSNPVGGT